MLNDQFENKMIAFKPDSAKPYQTAAPGLNLLGMCSNRSCLIKDQDIVITKGFGYFTIPEQENFLNRCPYCNEEMTDLSRLIFTEC